MADKKKSLGKEVAIGAAVGAIALYADVAYQYKKVGGWGPAGSTWGQALKWPGAAKTAYATAKAQGTAYGTPKNFLLWIILGKTPS